MIAHVQVRSSLVEEVKQLQHDGDFCKENIGQVRHGLNEESCVDDNGILWLKDCLVVVVCSSLALCLDMRFDVLNSLLIMLTSVGEVYLIIRFLSECEVCIEDEILWVDLVELRECLNDGVMFSISEAGGMIAHVQVRSSLVEEVK